MGKNGATSRQYITSEDNELQGCRKDSARGPEIMVLWLQDMYLRLGFSSEAARLLIREQGLDSPERLRVPTNENVDGICNVMRKPCGKSADGTPNRGS